MTRLTIYPAIDLKDGQCVRLKRGEMDQATVYSSDPGAQAAAWQESGFAWLHVVDLNGAFAGKPVNADAVRSILGAVQVPVQLGGGIRDMAGIEAWLEAGITRVILGSAAAKNPALVIDACRTFPGRIAVGIDARDGFVATEGWAETSSLPAGELVRIAAHVIRIQPHRLQQLRDLVREFARIAGELMDHQRLSDDSADGHARVKRRERVLKYDLHVAA